MQHSGPEPYWSSVWTRSPSRRGSFVLQPESSYCWCRLDRCRWIWSKATQRHTCQSRACRFRHVNEDYLVVPSGNLPNNCQYIFTLKHTFLQTFKIFEVSHFNDRWYDKCVNICECRHNFFIYIIFLLKSQTLANRCTIDACLLHVIVQDYGAAGGPNFLERSLRIS